MGLAAEKLDDDQVAPFLTTAVPSKGENSEQQALPVKTMTNTCVGTPRRNLGLIQYLFLASLLGHVMWVWWFADNANKTITTATTTTTAAVVGWVRPDRIYGFVHVPKTGGSDINKALTTHYERVCGNKGYSYDAYERDKRLQHLNDTTPGGGGAVFGRPVTGDAVQRLYEKGRRGKVPREWMEEIGFDDCDYITYEGDPGWFVRFASMWKMELHVPCRNVIDHFMSRINTLTYKNVLEPGFFNCSTDNLEPSSLNHVIHDIDNRFGKKGELTQNPNITLKCFNSIPPQKYVKYMGQILQAKRIQSEHFHRESNGPRHKDQECIWTAGEAYQHKLRQALLDFSILFRWCDACMGSDDELPL